jgi:hypothetical protein
MSQSGIKWFMFLLVMVPNMAFFLHWLNLMRIEVLKLAFYRGTHPFKMISCGLINPDAFYEDHIEKFD